MANGLHIKATIKNETEIKQKLLKRLGINPANKDLYKEKKEDILQTLGNMIRDIIIENVENETVGGMEKNRPKLSQNEESTRKRKSRRIREYGMGVNRPLREIDESFTKKENINVIVKNGVLYVSFNDSNPGTRRSSRGRGLTPAEKYEMVVAAGRKYGKNYEQIVPTRGGPAFMGRVVMNALRKIYKEKVLVKFNKL